MSTYPEYHETASAVERIARTVGDDQPLACAALHLAAQLLRRDERAAHERLTRLLHLVDVGDLLSSASIRLELESAAGSVDARRAAGHVAAAGVILYPGENAT
ncbi:MAG: hypothetical protein WCK70_04955 [Chloroflexales bacterium]